MKYDMLSVKNDLIFKMIFGDPKNKDIMENFLKSVLDIPHDEYDEMEIIDPNLRLDAPDGKIGILDIKLRTKNGKIVDVELQLLRTPEMIERILFYSSKMFTEQIGTGDSYKEIKKVISILILDYDMIKNKPKYIHKFLLHDKSDNTTLTDLLEIYVLELGKLPKQTDDTKLYDWLSLFNAKKEEEFSMIAERTPEIKSAVMLVKELSEDEETRLLAESYEKRRRDDVSRLEGAIKEEKRRTALEMLDANMDIEMIVRFTKLTREEIEALKLL